MRLRVGAHVATMRQATLQLPDYARRPPTDATPRKEGGKHHDRRTDADNPKVFYTPSASGLSSADHAEPGAHASPRHEQAVRPFMRDGVRAHEDPVAGTASA